MVTFPRNDGTKRYEKISFTIENPARLCAGIGKFGQIIYAKYRSKKLMIIISLCWKVGDGVKRVDQLKIMILPKQN